MEEGSEAAIPDIAGSWEESAPPTPMSSTSNIPSTPESQAKPDKDTESGIEHV